MSKESCCKDLHVDDIHGLTVPSRFSKFSCIYSLEFVIMSHFHSFEEPFKCLISCAMLTLQKSENDSKRAKLYYFPCGFHNKITLLEWFLLKLAPLKSEIFTLLHLERKNMVILRTTELIGLDLLALRRVHSLCLIQACNDFPPPFFLNI